MGVRACILLSATILFLLVFLGSITPSEGQSHVCTKTKLVSQLYYQYRSYRCVRHYYWHRYWYHYRHYYYYHYYWGWRWYWYPYYSWCYGRFPAYRNVPVTYNVCCEGWKGKNCDIPDCGGACESNGGYCLEPNKCVCPDGKEGNDCKISECPKGSSRWWNDCYPGTCVSQTKCQCYDGFTGDACNTIMDGAEFKSCSVQLLDASNNMVVNGTCGPASEAEEHIYYSSLRDLSKIVFNAKTFYSWPPAVPKFPQYVLDADIGNIDSVVKVAVLDENSNLLGTEQTFDCDTRPNAAEPYYNAECRDRTYSFPKTLGHNQRLRVRYIAETGGFKSIFNKTIARKQTHYYDGQTSENSLIVIFDILPPEHCHGNPTVNCSADDPPIVAAEFYQESNISLGIYSGWDDTDTGVVRYKTNIYAMGINAANQLDNVGGPVITETRDLLKTEATPIDVILPKPGRYSVEMDVTDRAGNVRKARSFLLFDDAQETLNELNKTVTLEGAVERSGQFWVTNFNENGPTDFTVTWEDVFSNKRHVDEGFLNPVKPKDPSWGYEDTFGNLTTTMVPHIDGITSFQLAYGVDSVGGEHTMNSIDDSFEEVALGTSSVISVTVDDGYSIVLSLAAYDVVGFGENSTNVVHIDSSPLVFTSGQFNKDVESFSPETVPFASELKLNAHDAQSGIDEVAYSLTLSSGKLIGSKSATDFLMTGVDADSCQANGGCYCTKHGRCYPQPVSVPIDNCLFMNNLNDPIKLTYFIYNGAGLQTTGTEINIPPVNSVFGLHEYPTASVFEARSIGNEEVDVMWTYPISCYEPIGVLILHGNKEIQLDYPDTNYTLDGLEPDKTYSLGLIIRYSNSKSEAKQLELSTGGCSDGTLPCNSLGAGAMVGIVIGVLLLILIVVIVVFMVLRMRNQKHPVPHRVRDAAYTIKNRFSRRFPEGSSKHNDYGCPENGVGGGAKALSNYRKSQGVTLNVSYKPGLSGTEDDIYTYGDMETDPHASWKHSGDKIQLGETLASGRFAEVKRATLMDKTGTTHLAAKMLKPGSSEEDRLLMKAKMNFLATSVPPHDNIVQLVGAVPSGDPVILLELCDMTLKEWLKSVSSVDDQVNNSMINLTTHIGKGLAHLHANHIIHRRLGVRNILIKVIHGQPIAKISGFGPMKAETEANNSEKEKIPFKWMAPEQIGLKSGQRRSYNQQTDVWTYGITVWEIFTKGESPYKSHKHGEIDELHKKGYKLPKPEHGPDEIYTEVILPCWEKKPKTRPLMSDIVKKIDSLYHGAAVDEYYYEADVKGKMNNAFSSSGAELYSDTV